MLALARRLNAGGVIAHWTSTLPGLAARPDKPSALKKIQRIKGRRGPFVVLAATPKHALQLVAWLPRDARAQIRSCWPGRTTLVLPAKRTGWIAALAHRGGIALRVDAVEHVRYLCRLAGGWLVSTSLNRKGQPPIAPSMRLRWRWHRWLDAVDASRPGTGKPSEILRWRASGWQRLR